MKRTIFIVLLSVIAAGCLNQCPLEVGDRVKNKLSEKVGQVMDIGSYGSMTEGCNIAVIHDDRTTSESMNPLGDGGYYDSGEYVRAWKYTRTD